MFVAINVFDLVFVESCDKLFELFNAFAAENTKKKPQVWPLQMMLLVLCPVSVSAYLVTFLVFFILSVIKIPRVKNKVKNSIWS